MTFKRVNKSSWNSPKEKKSSLFAPRPFANQTQEDSDVPLTQEDIENAAYDQHKFEATGLEIKKEYGTITPAEQEHLGVLQAKMKDFWVHRRENPSGFNYNFANVKVQNPNELATVEPKLTIGKPGEKSELEADKTGADVVQRIHAPRLGYGMNMSQPDPEFVQRMIANTVHRSGSIQRQERLGNEAELMKKSEEEAFQREAMPEKENKTGMPDRLKAGIESLSGISMDDVNVHYNSSKPAELQALAYAQGTDIHVASGQEKHLPHEAWHVVQQKQGRVKPTTQMKGVNANDDAELEKEADTMGAKALQMKAGSQTRSPLASSGAIGNTVQRLIHPDYATGLELAQRVSAMFAMATPDEQKAELGKLKIVAEPLKDSKASELAKLATVIAAGNTSILQHPRSSQIQSDASKVLSMAYEARDGGHSLDRHGPGVSDSQLQHRLSTGVAPDGVLSPTTGLSTRFNTHEDYVKTRLAAVQGMKTAIITTRNDLKNELKAFQLAKKAFTNAAPGPHKAPGQPLQLAIQNAQAAVQAKVNAIGNPDATKIPVKFVPNAAIPAGYITMYQSYSIIVDHGADVGIGFRGRPANQIHPRPTVADPAATAPAWTASDKEDHLTKTRTGMDTGANHQQLFGTDYNPGNWTAFQHFPVDEPVGIQI